MYEIELQGIGKTLKRKTNDIQKTFAEIAEEMKEDIYLGGAEFKLREGGVEANISLSSKKIRLFKNNSETRQFTEDYLMSQLKQLKSVSL